MSEHHYTHDHTQTELEKLLRRSKPWFEQNGTAVIYGLAAVLGLAALLIYLNRAPAGDVEASRDLLLASQPEDYRDIADNFPDTTIAVWSRLRQADRLLDNAVSNMFTNRSVGVEELDQAEAAYKRLAERGDVPAEVRERVLVGLARVAECRCDGSDASVETAVSAWKRVTEGFSNSLVREQAEARIAKLPTEESKRFYKWFHEQNPRQIDPGLAPGQPQVPHIPSLSIPEPATDDKPADGTAPEKADSDAGESAKPNDSATPPAADAEADENPGAEPKPEQPSTDSEKDKPAAPEPQPKSDAEKAANSDSASSEQTPPAGEDNAAGESKSGDK
ncbi:MAG: hypothetical protein KDA89_13785 [Planctomycetaceae bacterium]|nr:hypothetical protein [Planctomycetaceae bacterium]